MGKTHIWNEGSVRPGDRIKIVDELTTEERVQLAEIRKLGDTGVLESKADVLEALAKAARGHADASAIMDSKPYLFPDAGPPKTNWVTTAIVLNVLVLVAIVSVAAHLVERERPTLPTPSAPEAALQPSEEASNGLPTEKGRAVRRVLAKRTQVRTVVDPLGGAP